MSGDNVHRGPWGDRSDESGGAGGEPPGGGLSRRVAALEGDMKEVKATLTRIEASLGLISERVANSATKEDLARVTGALDTVAERVAGLAGRVDRTERTVEAKVLGPWQFPVILASSAGVLAIIFGAFNWLMTHGWLGR